jgi:arogenate dehydrogenase (NADP+)
MEQSQGLEMKQQVVGPPRLPGTVGIVGLGLIGGSLGLDLQALGCRVKGLVHRPVTVDRALQRGLAQEVSLEPAILQGCDLVILALPIESLLAPDPMLVAALPPDAVVTDVASVKTPVLQAWRGRHRRFVASHPMAGTAHSGVEAGLSGLFRDRPWIATPEAATDAAALELVEALARALGSHWLTAAPACHDQAVALISHVPVLVSAALLRAAGSERDPSVRELACQLASSGFADTTRVGAGNPVLGTAMAARNTDAVLRGLAAYRWSLEQLEGAILAGNWAQLERELEQTRALRPSFLKAPAPDIKASVPADDPAEP